jgi:cytochrome bd-type quinol oxidase subunit 2
VSSEVTVDRLQFTLTVTYHYLFARDGNPNSLTVDNAAAHSYGLEVAIVWWSFGMLLAAAYFVYAYLLFFRPH